MNNMNFDKGEPQLNKRNVAGAIIILVTKYRQSKGTPSHSPLCIEEVDEIVDGVKEMIMEFEELKPMKKI